MYVTDLLFDDQGFRNGLLLGTMVMLALTAVAVLRPQGRGGSGQPLRLAGVAAVATSLAALDRTGPSVLLSERLAWGLALLTVLPMVGMVAAGTTNRWAHMATFVVAVPGAIVVAQAAALDNTIGWVPELVAGAILIGGALAVLYDDTNARAGLPPVLLAVTAVGMWTTVPDTEQILVVVGVFLPFALLGWPVARASAGAAMYGVVGLLAWVAAVGGRGRPGSVIGALACLGILAVEPVVRWLWRGRAVLLTNPLSWRSLLSIGVHCGVVLVAARVAGLEQSARSASVIATAALVVGGAVMAVVIAPGWRRRAGPTELRDGSPPSAA